MRPFRLQPGEYMLPRAKDMKDCNAPEFVEKLNRGPVLPHDRAGERADVDVAATRAVVHLHRRRVGADSLPRRGDASRGCALPRRLSRRGHDRIDAYAAGVWPQSIWYQRPWSTTLKFTFDGLIYGLLTGGVFGWLWHMG